MVKKPSIHNGIYMGMKRQCVEFTRRWLYINKGFVYSDVDIAADVWDKVDYYTQVASRIKCPTRNFINGSVEPPEVGDLLIYCEKYLNTGHVAVVTKVNIKSGTVCTAEQNYENKYQVAGHKRYISLHKIDDAYWLLDGYLIGWKRVMVAD